MGNKLVWTGPNNTIPANQQQGASVHVHRTTKSRREEGKWGRGVNLAHANGWCQYEDYQGKERQPSMASNLLLPPDYVEL